jgi:hypothetical protein
VIGTRRVGGGGRTEEIKDLAMKTRYSFELWDLWQSLRHCHIHVNRVFS